MGIYIDILLLIVLPVSFIIIFSYLLWVYSIKQKNLNSHWSKVVITVIVIFLGGLCIGIHQLIEAGVIEFGENIKKTLLFIGLIVMFLGAIGGYKLEKERVIRFFKILYGKELVIWTIIAIVVVFFILMLEGEL